VEKIMSKFDKIVNKVLNEAEKMPRVIYPSEIDWYFSSGYYSMLRDLLYSSKTHVTVKADNGNWYIATKVDATRSHDTRIKLKKTKAPE
jgi:hypothetical protein